jgi:hypothetical protein
VDQRPNRKVCGDCRRDGGVTGGAEMCRGGAAWASGFVHRGEWPRSVSSYPMELGLSGAKRVVHSFAGRKGGWSWRDNGFFWTRQMVVECAVQCVRQWWFNLQWVQWFWINWSWFWCCCVLQDVVVRSTEAIGFASGAEAVQRGYVEQIRAD